MVRPQQTLAQISQALRHPRSRGDVYREYNTLRQEYILQATARHFGMREDNPAPLYGKTLLDVGCGESTIAEFLALSGAEITAIDPDREALEKAVFSAEAFGAPISFINARAETLLQEQRKYDIILALDILEETEKPAKLIWVLSQLLAPGGMIVFSCISRTPMAWFYHIFLSSYIYRRTRPGSRRYRRFHTTAQLRRLCAAVNLKLSGIQGMRFSFSRQRWKKSALPRTRYMATATIL